MGTVKKDTTPFSPVSVERLIGSVYRPDIGRGIQDYICGHCERSVGGLVIAGIGERQILWLLCPSCGRGSVQHDNTILPLLLSVPQVRGLPSGICQVYDEARKSFAVEAYTGCELLCRKILMSVAVDRGAAEDKSFEHYVDHLKDNGHITASLKDMTDIIRKNGNQSAHKIGQPDPKRAEYTLEFTAQVLRSIYEIKDQFSKYQNNQASP